MKKINVLIATAALALPLAAAPLAPATTLIANAATVKKATPAKATTYTLKKATSIKKTAYHAKKAGDKYKIEFAADRATAKVSKSKTKLSTKKTYTTSKTIELLSSKKGAKEVKYLHLKNDKGEFAGWVKASEMTKGALGSKAPAKAKATKLTLTKKAKAIKKAYTATKKGEFAKAVFAKDGKTATLTKAGTLTSGKKYDATKSIYAKTSTKATAHEYVLLKDAGWTLATNLKAAK